MTETALEWFVIYGLPVYFAILAASAFGVPMPVKLLMLVVGALVQEGDIQFWQALAIGSAGAVTGDQAGYLFGRYGGRTAIEKATAKLNGARMLAKAEVFAKRWGLVAVFFSRWLVTPLGPWINLISGSTRYSWTKFTVAGVIGEVLWILIYVSLGVYFSDRIQLTAELLTNITWLLVGVTAVLWLGHKVWKIFENHRNSRPAAD
jgi:membrane protein DedA with SNARE-associated domain